MALRDKLRTIKRTVGAMVPDDEIEDALDRARSFVTDNAGDVARAAGRAIYTTDTFGPRSSLKDVRAGYDELNRKISDPTREIVQIAGEEDFNPVTTARRAYQTERSTGLGESFRRRPNTLGKRVLEGLIDPLNLIPFGTAIGGAKAAGVPITRSLVRAAIREMAVPAVGQIAGHEIGQAIGGERGAQIGEFAGLLGGSFGPNLVRGGESSTLAVRAGRSANDRAPSGALGIMPATPSDRPSGQRWYHGATEGFDQFELGRQPAFDDEGRLLGDAVYLAKKPDLAGWYATEGAFGSNPPIGANVRPVVVSKDARIYNLRGTLGGNGWDQLVRTVERGARKLQDTDALDAIQQAKRYTPHVSSDRLLGFDQIAEFMPHPSADERRTAVTRLLGAAGYDGIRHDDPNGGEALAIWNLDRLTNAISRTAMGIAPTDRYYHGTGSAFDRPDAARFDPNGLFGPGYYLTSDPRVASDYGRVRSDVSDLPRQISAIESKLEEARFWQRTLSPASPGRPDVERTIADLEPQLERLRSSLDRGPNIRPVNVPRDLRLLPIEDQISQAEIDRIINTLRLADVDTAMFRRWKDAGTPIRGQQLWEQLAGSLESGGSATGANRLLQRAGYDGIRYDGGKRIPLMDNDGNPITHEAIVIFPQSLDKLTNALSGTPGGLLPGPQPAGRTNRGILGFDRAGLKADLIATGFGAAANVGREVVFEDERDPRELAKAALIGAGFGATGAHVGRLQRDLLPVSRVVGESSPSPRIAGQVGPGFGATDDLGSAAPPPRRPPPVADAAAAAEPPSEQERRTLLGMAGSLLNLGRQFMLSGDAGQFGRIGVIGFLNALSAGRPFAGAKGVAKAAFAAVSPRYAERQLASGVGARWKGIAFPEDMVQPEFSSFIQKIPGFGHLERAMFQRFTPILAAEVAEAMDNGLRTSGDFGRMTEAQRMQEIGHWVQQGLIGKPIDEVMSNRVGQAIARFSLLSPRWTFGQLANVQALGSRGPEGELARRFWAATALTAIGTSVGVTAYLTGKDPKDLMNPTHPDSLLDPRKGSRFLAVETKGGTLVRPFQPISPVLRLLLRPAVAGGEAAYEAGGLDNLKASALAFFESGAGEARTAATQYLLGRTSPPVRLFNDLAITGTDFFGNPIVTKEGAAGVPEAALYAARQFVPIVAQPLAEQVERVPGTEPTKADRAIEGIANFFGVAVKPGARLPDDVASAMRDEIRRRGVEPVSADADLQRQFRDLKLDADERARFYREHPQVRAFTDERTRVLGEKFDKPEGRSAVNQYNAERRTLKEARTAALRQLETENLPGDEYRRRRSIIMDRYRIGLERTQEMLLGTADPDRVQALIDAAYKDRGEDGPVDTALDGLYAIRQDGETREAQDDYFRRRDEYLESLSPEIREKMLQRQIDDAPTQTERAYVVASNIYAEYAKLPAYRGMTVEESRDASRIAQEARDYAQFSGKSASSYLLRRRDLTPAQKRNARKALAGAKYANRERKRFLREHEGAFARFYSSLNTDLVEEITEPDPRLALLNS